MSLVVDASVAVKWLIAEEGSDDANRLVELGDDLHAPRLMASEVANAVWRKVRLGELETAQAGALMATVTKMPVRWNTDETFCADAIRLALALDRPVYDCVYLALAYRIGAQVVTADERFARALASTDHRGKVMTMDEYATAN